MKIRPWYEKPVTVWFYDQYMPDYYAEGFGKYDPDRIAGELLESDADVYVIYARNQWGMNYYPSEVDGIHPALKGRDYFGEITSRLKAKGKRVIAYINWYDSRYPEWLVIPRGSSREEELKWHAEHPERWIIHCLNSPKRELIKKIAAEIIAKYPVDGLHLDMFLEGRVCTCKYCQPGLKKILGKGEVDKQDLDRHWDKYIDWRKETSSSLMRELRQLCTSKDKLFVPNYFANPFISAQAGPNLGWLENVDITLSESYFRIMRDVCDIDNASIMTKFLRALGKPHWTIVTHDHPGFAFTSLAREEFLLDAAMVIANGGQGFGPCGVGAHLDSSYPRKGLDTVNEAFHYYDRFKKYLEGVQSSAKVGILYSFNTRDYVERGAPLKYRFEFLGFARLLFQKHIPFDIVVSELVKSVDDLKKYELLILPNVTATSADTDGIIEEYVTQGGKIIATYATSLYDEKGKRKSDFALADVLGVNYHKEYEFSHFYIEDEPDPVSCTGGALLVNSKAQVLSRLVKAVHLSPPLSFTTDTSPLERTDVPMTTKQKFGKGEALYIACQLASSFYDYGYWGAKELLGKILSQIYPQPEIETNLPSTVEIMVLEQPEKKRKMIHLVNKTVNAPNPGTSLIAAIDTIVPLKNVALTITVGQPLEKAEAINGEISFRQVGEKADIHLSQLNTHEMIVLQLK